MWITKFIEIDWKPSKNFAAASKEAINFKDNVQNKVVADNYALDILSIRDLE